jgi:hypothetical protein
MQLLTGESQSYGVELERETMKTLEVLYSLNTTWTPDTDDLEGRRAMAASLVVEIVKAPVDAALSGTLWLFPTSVSKT